MKALAIFLVCLAAIIVGIVAIGYSSCEEPLNPGSATLETAAQRASTCASVTGAFRAGMAGLWSFARESHDEIIALSVVLIAIFTVISGVFIVELASSATKATREIKNSFEQQLRAYLGARGGTVALKQVGPQTFIEGHVFLKNSGRTPAYDHRTWVRIEIKDAARSPFDLPGNGFGGSIVSPDGEAHLPVQWPVSDADIEAVRNETKRIFVWGGADFVDAFGKARFIKFYLWNAKEAPGTNVWPLIASDKPDEAN